MVKLVLPALAAIALAGCDTDRYTRPIAHTPHGDAVRNNMAAQIIDPAPPARRPVVTPSHGPLLALDNLRTGQVKDPTAQSTAPLTTSSD